MRLRIVAVGRQKAGPEKSLVTDYLDRFAKTGRALGLPPCELVEIDERKHSSKTAQGAALAKHLTHSVICALDERGVVETSPALAKRLITWRDTSQDVSFVIGGADGIDEQILDQAQHKLSFGPMVWPHMLARVMLSEQLYRSATIIAGTPYHRV